MEDKVLSHFLGFSTYTFPGHYLHYLQEKIPFSVREFGPLIRKNFIHRATLHNGNTGSNSDLRYGDMTKIHWWQQPEDDILPTVGAILTELFRRDPRGLIEDRQEASRPILTCRFLALLTASIFKSKGIPSRVRSGFAPYVALLPEKSSDHWITQYWEKESGRWITVDIDCCLEPLPFDPFDVPDTVFETAACSWLGVRQGRIPESRFWNAGNFSGLIILAWELVYDFHCLMNNEVIYLHTPALLRLERFQELSELDLKELDGLAERMLKPDDNLQSLEEIWSTNRNYRLLSGGLL